MQSLCRGGEFNAGSNFDFTQNEVGKLAGADGGAAIMPSKILGRARGSGD